MARKRESALGGWVFFGALIAVGLLVLIWVLRMSSKPLTERDAVATAVEGVKAKKNLSAEEETVLKVQLAIVDYISKRGTAPNSLSELIPTYFDVLPKNPRTNQPFDYRKLEKGRYTLGVDRIGGTQVASASAGGKETGISEGQVPVTDENFVNPNTMEEDPFVYDASGKRDPFVPFDLAPAVAVDPNKTPLEQYSLEQLRFTGVIEDAKGQKMAMVEDSSGKGFTVRVGTKIGNAGGVAVAVEQDKLKILESRVDFSGKETEKMIEMPITTHQTVKKPSKKKS